MNKLIKKLNDIILEYESYSKTDNVNLEIEDLEILFHEDSYIYENNDAKNFLFKKKNEIIEILNELYNNKIIAINLNSIEKLNISNNTYKIIYKFLFDNDYLISDNSYLGELDNVSLYFNDLQYYPRLSNEEQHKYLIKHNEYLMKINERKKKIITYYFPIINELSMKYSNNNNERKKLIKYQINLLLNLFDENNIFFDINKMKEYFEKRVSKFSLNKINFKNNNFDFNVNDYIINEKISKDDAINSYKEILSLEKERIKLKKFIVERNLKLVISVAKYYKNSSNLNGLTFLDLIQEGNMGLMKALDKYDVYNSKFSTYAVFWIKQGIQRAIAGSKIIRMPVHFYAKLSKYNAFFTRYYEENGDIPSDELVMEKLGFSKEELIELKNGNAPISSLNDFVGEEEHGVADEIGDFIEDKNQNVENQTLNIFLKEDLMKVLSDLTIKQRIILILRFGIIIDEPIVEFYDNYLFLITKDDVNEDKIDSYLKENGYSYVITRLKNPNIKLKIVHTSGAAMTLESISTIFNLTRERVRQIEAKALYTLKNKKNKKLLLNYIDN